MVPVAWSACSGISPVSWRHPLFELWRSEFACCSGPRARDNLRLLRRATRFPHAVGSAEEGEKEFGFSGFSGCPGQRLFNFNLGILRRLPGFRLLLRQFLPNLAAEMADYLRRPCPLVYIFHSL